MDTTTNQPHETQIQEEAQVKQERRIKLDLDKV